MLAIENDATQHLGFVDEEELNLLKDVADPMLLDIAAIEDDVIRNPVACKMFCVWKVIFSILPMMCSSGQE